ncbi:hypothetical protein Csa_019757 [Cucumis sativus]|nr:hypothetical protein Csa_019757 [Cucumis sativus]
MSIKMQGNPPFLPFPDTGLRLAVSEAAAARCISAAAVSAFRRTRHRPLLLTITRISEQSGVTYLYLFFSEVVQLIAQLVWLRRNVKYTNIKGKEKELKGNKNGDLQQFNKREEDFSSLREYNDYLEEVEDMTFNLIEGIDVQAIEAKIARYQEENAEQIMINRARKVPGVLLFVYSLSSHLARNCGFWCLTNCLFSFFFLTSDISAP